MLELPPPLPVVDAPALVCVVFEWVVLAWVVLVLPSLVDVELLLSSLPQAMSSAAIETSEPKRSQFD